MTHHVYDAAGLRQFGINPLTGEACGHSMRVLCDLSEQGAEVIRAFYGLPHDAKLADNWNSLVGEEPAIASCFVPRDTFRDLAVFAIFHCTQDVVVFENFSSGIHVMGVSQDDIAMYGQEALARMYGNHRSHTRPGTARNAHQFTERTL